jgi:peptidyl-tRNA hydrolase
MIKMSNVNEAADWMLEGHEVSSDNKNYYVYDYNAPNEEFAMTITELRANTWKITKNNKMPTKPEYIMYIFANKKYKMSPGKLSKQVADGACFGALNTDKETTRQWIQSGFNKMILEVADEYELKDIQKLLVKYDIASYLITDKTTGTCTALGVQIVDKNKYNEFFSKYRLYKKVSLWEKIITWFKKMFSGKKKDEYK